MAMLNNQRVKFPSKNPRNPMTFPWKIPQFPCPNPSVQRQRKHPDLGHVVAFCHLGCAVHIEVPAEADEDLVQNEIGPKISNLG
jgi:hypothetical protein